jgi:predicted dehydrogenase
VVPPTFAAGPDTTLAGVWARRPDAAAVVAGPNHAPVFEDLDALIDACDAVAFAVPPAVQADLAVRVARAGRAVLLEKPIAADLAGAERLAAAVAENGVVSQVLFTWRYTTAVALLDGRRRSPFGGRASFVGALLGGRCGPGGWRRRPARPQAASSTCSTPRWVSPPCGPRRSPPLGRAALDHEGGAVSEASLTAASAHEPMLVTTEVFGPTGGTRVDGSTAVDADTFPTVARELAAAVRSGTSPALDVHHGLRIQRLLDAAATDLATGAEPAAG